MAIFRIEKTQNYTVMSNHHLRNSELSLKAKGLLSQILSLPENWDYTLKGLSQINRESVDAIRSAIGELERAGYISRTRERKDNGQLGGTEYIIHEQPQPKSTPPTLDEPTQEQPTLDQPILENPTQANPMLENPSQLNKDIQNKDLLITESLNTHSIPFPSTDFHVENKDENGKGAAEFEIYRKIICENLEYSTMISRHKYDIARIDEIVELMAETVCSSRRTIRIASDDFPAEIVRSRFLKLTSEHLEFVLDCMRKNTTEVRNMKKYLLAVLFNAPTTMDSYYTSLVAQDTG